MGWTQEEFGEVEFGDRRLNKRLMKLAEQLAQQPQGSIPKACGGWGDTRAAYRLFENERCDWREIIQTHGCRAMSRMAEQEVVLCIQDTTELDFNGQKIEGLGPLSYEAQRGMYVHPTYAVSVDREPLGVLDAWMWAREFKDKDGQRAGVCESVRWIEGYERLAEQAAELPKTRLVQVGDRESDILALMQRGQELGWPVDLLIRARHDRALPDGKSLWSKLDEGASRGEIEFGMGARPGHRARKVRQQIRFETVELSKGKAGQAPLSMTCIVATEVGAAPGEKPVCWRLLSNRPVDSLEQAVEQIQWYRARWEIEMFFHVFKNGCKVEALQLTQIDRIERALALYMVVAWRINRLMRLGRTCPDLPAALLFEVEEIQAAYVLNKKAVPEQTPDLNTVVRLIARLGGFLGRKSDGEPGVKTLWLGFQRITDFANGIRFTRSGMT